MDGAIFTEILKVSGAVALATISLAFGAQKLLKDWKQGTAESSVLGLMHQELGRMAIQNTTLSKELNNLQLELVNLNKELYKLTLENQRLHNEVVTLTSEIDRLKTQLDKGGLLYEPTV